MSERFTEDDYQLRWPRTLFVEEAAHLLSHRNTGLLHVQVTDSVTQPEWLVWP